MNHDSLEDALPPGVQALNALELRALAQLDPPKLLRWINDSCSAFLFGIERGEADEAAWGGRYRVMINRNVEVHFVPSFNDAMLDVGELPQFSVMPDDRRAGQSDQQEVDIGDGESVTSVVFYVPAATFQSYLGELAAITFAWSGDPVDPDPSASFPFLPECYFRETGVMPFLERIVLPHELVAAERPFDGRHGYPVPPDSSDINEEIPPPVIDDDDEDEDEDSDAADPIRQLEALGQDVEAREEAIREARRRAEGY